MNEYKHFGVYGLIINEEKILLIKKFGGPYNNKLDLPGGTIEFGERPQETLKRELKEEVGIDLIKYELLDVDSVLFDWKYNDNLIKVHHTGIIYKILEYKNEIQTEIKVDEVNDDSLGADWYNIKDLNRCESSNILLMELEYLGYIIK